MSHEIPRHADMRRWCPAERAIYEAMLAVEKMPADVLLTEAVTLLGDAQRKVAEFIDAKQEQP